MDTNQLKRFAQAARMTLLEQVSSKLNYVLDHDSAELRGKADTIKKLKQDLTIIGREALVDKVAYVWFNRLIALRFMDANGYQPLGISIVSPVLGHHSPQILDDAHRGIIHDKLSVDRDLVMDTLDNKVKTNNPDNNAYRLLLVAACNHLNTVFPFLFERIDDYTELLLPEDLTSSNSIITDVVAGMSEEDCKEVEIIGWLYQFYISDKKDEVFASKSSVEKEDIPAATQLFTPRWIVEYMVQNTVGKLWLQNKPNSSLKDHMPYYIESPSSTSKDYLKLNSIEELRLLDQACGSGHILVYGFELLYKIYEEEGFNPNEIPQLIIENNLFGFEIDERAAQLAAMAVMMKARSYNSRFFRKEIKPNILLYKDLLLTDEEIKDTFKQIAYKLTESLEYDLTNIQQATNFGSLIIPKTSTEELDKALSFILSKENTNDMFLRGHLDELQSAIEQLIPLSRKYHCVVDNPPYMGGGNMNKVLSNYVKVNYPDSKADLMTCFMESGWNMLLPKGLLGMINLPSWLFLSSFEKLRKKLIKEKHINSLLHMGRGIFGIDWGSVAFIIQNQQIDAEAKYYKLHKRNFQHIYADDIGEIFLKAKNDETIKINFDKYREGEGTANVDDLVDESGLQISYTTNQRNFAKIPGSPIGYWISKKILDIFDKSKTLSEVGDAKQGLATADNNRFIRLWSEVSQNKSNYNAKSINDSILSHSIWFPYNKGGDKRRWYGNQEYVVNWEDDGYEIRNFLGKNGKVRSAVRNPSFYFRESISWGLISSLGPSFRFYPHGFIYDVGGMSYFPNKKISNGVVIASLNSKLFSELAKLINPTINLQIGDVAKLPFCEIEKVEIENLTTVCINISKEEWDTSETSWNLKLNELIRIKEDNLRNTYDSYQQYWTNQFFQLHENEEELNRQFIEIYGLEDELTPDVSLEDITILKEETKIIDGELVFQKDKIFQQFMSYAVGCMFGRYSLDKEGLILANQGETLEDYLEKVGIKEGEEGRFMPDEDNIIPVLDKDWFKDDIVDRFYEFLKVSFGEKNFQNNLSFVEECLGRDIRTYFVRDFYKDHIQRYKKRPIYWMFSSPKKHFNVLVYLHRYSPDTMNRILNSYLREFIEKLNINRKQQEHIAVVGSGSEQSAALREIDKIDIMLLDCKEYEIDILYPLASERIKLDLDDGVLVNYNKMGKAVFEVDGLNDKKTKKKVKEFDWIDTSLII